MSTAAPDAAARDGIVRLFSDALGGRLAVALFATANIALVARGVGPATYGVYATATAFATLLYFFTDLGSSNVVVRETGDPASAGRAVATYLHARALLIALTCLGGVLLVPFVFEAGERSAAFLALGILVFSGPSIASPLGQVYGSMRLYRVGATLQGFAQLLLTAAVIFLVEEPSATLLVGALVVACASATTWVFLRLRATVRGLPTGVDRAALRSMLWSVGIIGLSGVLVTIYYRIDGLLLLRLRGPEEAGLYAAAYRLMDQAKILPAVLLVPIAPLLSREIAANGRLRASLDRPLMHLSLLAGLGLALLAAAVAPVAVNVLMGDAFAETTILFEMLLISLAWSPLAFVLGSKAINARLERPYLAVAALGVIVNVGLNLVLIPEWGARGAAAATVVTELATVCTLAAFTGRVSAAPQLPLIAAAVFGGAIAAGVALGRGAIDEPLQVAVSVLLGVLGCAALAQAFRFLRSERLDAA